MPDERRDGPKLSAFEGCWRIVRRIEDRLAARTLTFRGDAEFVREGSRLRCRETGWLRGAGPAALRSERTWLWQPATDGIAVLYADGRPFHRIGAGPCPQAHHACDPDAYRVRYDFRAWPEWVAVWEVSGPRKDYTLTSRYAR